MRFRLWQLFLISLAVHFLLGLAIFCSSSSRLPWRSYPAERNLPGDVLLEKVTLIPPPDWETKPPSSPGQRPPLVSEDSSSSAPVQENANSQVAKGGPAVAPAKPGDPSRPASQEETDQASSSIHAEISSETHFKTPTRRLKLPNFHFRRDQKVVFVLDVSGSMYEECEGSSRLALAQQVLATLIREVPEGMLFCVVQYGEKTKRSGPLSPAKAETRRAAIRFLAQDYDLGGGTDLPAGLVTAQDVSPDRVILATDGDLNMSLGTLIARTSDILLSASGHRVAFDVIGVLPRPNTDGEEVLKRIAQVPSGNYISAQLEP